MLTLWHSTSEFCEFLLENTSLGKRKDVLLRPLVESDASRPREFHAIPTHIKQILYLDAPDLIIELDGKPILALEISTEAGTGHNVFQRFGRLAAAVERRVPTFYIYPEAVFVRREASARYDRLNPLIFTALEYLMRLYGVPAFLFIFPGGYPSLEPPSNGLDSKGLKKDKKFPSCPSLDEAETTGLLSAVEFVLAWAEEGKEIGNLIHAPELADHRNRIASKAFKDGWEGMSPLSSTRIIPTTALLQHLQSYAGPTHDFKYLLPSRAETVVYCVDAGFRGDPYPGALAAIDYILARNGATYEDRHRNIAMAWGQFSFNAETNAIAVNGNDQRSVERFMEPIRQLYADRNRVLLWKRFDQLSGSEISRYYMQVRFGTTFTKRKDIRMYSYFADALLFPDGALWREG